MRRLSFFSHSLSSTHQLAWSQKFTSRPSSPFPHTPFLPRDHSDSSFPPLSYYCRPCLSCRILFTRPNISDSPRGWNRCLSELDGEPSEYIISCGTAPFLISIGMVHPRNICSWHRTMVSRWAKRLPFLPKRPQPEAKSPSPQSVRLSARILSYNEGIQLYG